MCNEIELILSKDDIVLEKVKVCDDNANEKKSHNNNENTKKIFKLNEKGELNLSDTGITTINPGAFTNIPNLQKIKLPACIQEIKPFAVYGCNNFESFDNISYEKCKIADNAVVKTNEPLLCIRKLKAFKNKKFYIKNYQRGYRWTELEVTELLEDILTISDNEEYCMQPLIVKETKTENGCLLCYNDITNNNKFKKLEEETGVYELIDGQQRLTTLFLILDYFKNNNACFQKYNDQLNCYNYEIYYEFERVVDRHYLQKAQTTIENFFNNNNIEKFINNLEKLFFIWYEIKNKESSEKIFQNVNAGKIPLTNAELFKALLLSDSNNQEDDKRKEIAFEWDKMESNLRDDDFWNFISNDTSDKKTRIDYVLEIYAKNIIYKIDKKEITGNRTLIKKLKNLDFNKEKFAFLVIQNYLNIEKKEKSAYDVWEDIVKVYNKLLSWYKDDDLYHLIGFMIACEEPIKGSQATASNKMCELYNGYNNTPVEEFKKVLKQQIREEYFIYSTQNNNKTEYKPYGIGNLKYEYDNNNHKIISRSKLKYILLFSNIYDSYFSIKAEADNENKGKEVSNPRIPFKLYKPLSKWDIEHVASQQTNKDLFKIGDVEKIREALESLQKDLDDKDNNQDQEKIGKFLEDIKKIDNFEDGNFKNIDGINNIEQIWQNHIDHIEVDNEISNLVLLDKSTNREYGNAFFNRKRATIMEKIKQGVFVPPCTKKVFLKFYTKEPNNLYKFDKDDKDAYNTFLEDMITLINKWKEENNNEN